MEPMDQEKFERWCSENGTGVETKWINGIEYRFVAMLDGRFGMFEVDGNEYFPCTRVRNMADAISYFAMIAPGGLSKWKETQTN